MKKLLLVDDNAGDVALMKEAFSDAELELNINVASSGEEAIQKVQDDRPDLIIIDTQMPGINGFEACKRIKEIDSSVKVAIQTGVMDTVDSHKANEVGADDYFVKTSGYSFLVASIRNLLNE